MQKTLYCCINMCRNMPFKIYTKKSTRELCPSPLRTVTNINSNARWDRNSVYANLQFYVGSCQLRTADATLRNNVVYSSTATQINPFSDYPLQSITFEATK